MQIYKIIEKTLLKFKFKIKREINWLRIRLNCLRFGPMAAYWIETIIIFAKNKSSLKVTSTSLSSLI